MITSADATILMIVEGLFPVGFQLEKFAADGAWSVENRQVAETRMGVDGQMAAGWVPQIKQVTFTLEADSPSLPFLEQIIANQEQKRTLYPISLLITIPSIGKIYSYTKGVFHDVSDVSAGEQVLGTREFTLNFEKMDTLPF